MTEEKRRNRTDRGLVEPEVRAPRGLVRDPSRMAIPASTDVPVPTSPNSLPPLPPPPPGLPLPSAEVIARQVAHAVAELAQMGLPRDTNVFERPRVVQVEKSEARRGIDPRLFLLHAPDSPVAASFRVLRHRLSERKDLKAILVSSPATGEGKTVCAANLALALGEEGRARVLILEANFRRPALANLFRFRPPVCFSAQLEAHRDQPNRPWVATETVAPWLHAIAVAPDAKSRPLLDGAALARCIEALRRAEYDYIVIDSPPVLESADVNLIEESVDGILITMWARRSRMRALRKAVDQIGRTKLMGVVLLGT